MRIVIVTGISGAGKSTALKVLEDVGYFCVDNLPVSLIPKMAELLMMQDAEMNKAALGVDIRSGRMIYEMAQILDKLDDMGLVYEILFMDARDSVLIKRYKETRRSHPLAGNTGNVEDGIMKEREALDFLKQKADYVLDTSYTLTRELRAQLVKMFVENVEYKNLYVTVMSFGFKYGIPADADLVFDVRFLPNPYYVDELRPKTGNFEEVRQFVRQGGVCDEFVKKLDEMVSFLIPNYIDEGKSNLVIAVGCTGGKHRSVTVANMLYEILLKKKEIGLRIEHRDIGKDAITKAR